MIENFMNMQFMIPAGIGLAVVFVLYLISKLSKENDPKVEYDSEPIKDDIELEKGEPVLCRVSDNRTGRIANEYISYKMALAIKERFGTLGRKFNREGKEVYGLVRVDDTDYKPVLVPNKIYCSPQKLYIDIQQQEVPIVFDISDDKSFMEKYGPLLWWVAVIVFIMFLWSQS